MKNNIRSNLINFSWRGTELELYSNKVLFVPQTRELLLCDIHIGKAEYFQINGVPLTNNEDEDNLNRIYDLLDKFNPKKLVILGDLFHSKYSLNRNLRDKVENLFQSIKNIELIEGNHDKGCYLNNINYLKEKKSLNLIYSHEPIKTNNEKILNICGHYHPKIILRSFNDRISFKCFALDSYNNNLYLPSFGDLTGGYLCKKNFKKWPIISENKIIELK
tara:strand:- start:974 stop:1630 length:657 start_codon:yes stop_codon:yes gene_type:complete